MPEKLIFDEETARAIAYEDHEEFEVISEEEGDGGRWTKSVELVVRRRSDGKLFISWYTVGKTEMQDQDPYEYDDPEFYEAEEVIVQRKEYQILK